MSGQPHHSLIKKLYTSQPREALLDLDALHRMGISSQRAASYARNGWLNRIGHGLYAFPETEPSLGAGFAYLARQIAGLHVGGDSVLREASGDQAPLLLWGDDRASLPRWFVERYPARYRHARLFDWNAMPTLHAATLERQAGLLRSTPERALLEMLYEVGCTDGLTAASTRFGAVNAICPLASGRLLEHCTSVKAVRLYLRLARRAQLLDVDELLGRWQVRVGSEQRWVSRLKDGTTLSLGPHG
ncbi:MULTISPECIES: type IV toxin-antitoxin system AbiEi family antitoxin domain-containing protein [unclassified Pseudomonas]|uniref:type IV toxin-antitoxin system AbiEi family antitoxin domain-containing protein n=1 Tax=unclassified Pseudomonas TaxID=196821 RepID=UPI0024498A4A|nr:MULTISPECIES: type IV toxin-antitoxin system AbiEi family antitoxin domain-containing protein [unclassified Pseudomonas]MDH0304310.1 type IV toxin-antitoxin system AbiEi family antitoxin [Pseudomonas sp. GD04091]MDH1983287.1 type IV toxin-antitoxin system AbiEi family antitoxin [Pseudomonas sp. GD03689]